MAIWERLLCGRRVTKPISRLVGIGLHAFHLATMQEMEEEEDEEEQEGAKPPSSFVCMCVCRYVTSSLWKAYIFAANLISGQLWHVRVVVCVRAP